MRYSKLFGKTIRDDPKDEVSVNAKLLIRGGFIRKEVAGVYNFLPLGLRVLNKISTIVREEMNAAGGQELLLSSLQNRVSWEQTKRWDSFDALFKVKSRFDTEYALGPTHEEVIVPLAKQLISSYRDLPLSLYQIQTKFRDEERAKSGILRGREFLMKDLYSFHADESDFNKYYEIMKKAYKKVYERCGLDAIETQASGGAFSKFSHEYQVITEAGEDEIIYCPSFVPLSGTSAGKPGCHFAENKEIAVNKEGDNCPVCSAKLKAAKTIEVGNIFPLKTRFSEAFNLVYKDKNGKEKFVVMGCYGIGIPRLMGTIVEVHNDDRGIKWSESIAPYQAHVLCIKYEVSSVKKKSDEVYRQLENSGIEVLFDDREDVSAGQKFADADLIGIPVRLVVSEKTGDKIEFKKRDKKDSELLEIDEVIKRLRTEEKP
ncbi:MAG: aminoacyl--tRNA ligase-related protein [bacterium]|nr:aminoacyl--tRNA ligase-related protein [bacterium]